MAFTALSKVSWEVSAPKSTELEADSLMRSLQVSVTLPIRSRRASSRLRLKNLLETAERITAGSFTTGMGHQSVRFQQLLTLVCMAWLRLCVAVDAAASSVM